MTDAGVIREVHYVMGTLLDIATWGPRERALEAIRRSAATARALERLFSAHDPRSLLGVMNRLGRRPAGGLPPAAFTGLVRRARAWRDRTGGAFDAEVRGPLDLGGIAKGYAVDRIARALRRAGIRQALINFGESSLYAIGAPPGLPAWPVVLRGHTAGKLAGGLWLRDRALSVSATHRRDLSGRRLGAHVFDPRTSRRLRRPALAAVVGPSAETAEALSTALLVRGPQADALFAPRPTYRALYLGAEGPCRWNGFSWHAFAPASQTR